MAYTIAGIDVHKRLLAVVVADLTADGEYAFERRQFGSTPAQRGLLADWLSAHEVDEVVMESTAQYWKPVWAALERHWTPRARARAGAGPLAGTLHLAVHRQNPVRRQVVDLSVRIRPLSQLDDHSPAPPASAPSLLLRRPPPARHRDPGFASRTLRLQANDDHSPPRYHWRKAAAWLAMRFPPELNGPTFAHATLTTAELIAAQGPRR